MADRTINGERGLHMVGIRCAVVVRHMTQIAGAAGQVVVVVDVTLGALQVRVPIGQRETDRVVIETRRLPSGRVVAELAGCREIRRNVVRIRGLLIVWHMASAASCRSAFELIVDVTCVARQHHVRSGQCIAGELQVIKTNVEPGIETVALLA